MFQVLIVDDELHAVKGVASGVDWARIGVTKIHQAYNIRQAKEVFEQHPVELMVCDIEMPQGSGLELMAWVKERYPETIVVFLTCHADFQFARQALQLGSFDYLLKPVRYAELESVLARGIERLEKLRAQSVFNQTYLHYQRLWESHQPLLIERFWLHLIGREIPSHPDRIQEVLVKQGIPYRAEQRFIPVFIRIQRWHKELSLREEKIMAYALRSTLQEAAAEHGVDGICIQVQRGEALAIFEQENLSLDKVREAMQHYVRFCTQYYYCDLSCYVGEPATMHHMTDRYEQLVLHDAENVTRMNEVFVTEEVVKKQDLWELPRMEMWSEYMMRGERGKLEEELHSYFESLKQVDHLDAKLLKDFFHNFLQRVYHMLQVKGLQAHPIFADKVTTERTQAAVRSIYHLQQWTGDVLARAWEQLELIERTSTVVAEVKRYIQDHLDQMISRDELALRVYLNPDYLTRIFKKETGLSISDYVLQERMKKAKHLLMHTDIPVSQIAASIGYANFSHFSKMFKKVTDTNPQHYRRQVKS
ncbi:helix-turn-helix domain-containing protein [Paenibacillus guangzhouensis]|uniref:helix-turn-helix domain-containing protein n=1 Tax=Paenibacillus guangzhouensis TaxID=1473112 RepID=UPI001266FEA5|nr:helix-turn-helix domain-containing protein [Paenibacillus guangzhouensis]